MIIGIINLLRVISGNFVHIVGAQQIVVVWFEIRQLSPLLNLSLFFLISKTHFIFVLLCLAIFKYNERTVSPDSV